MVAEQPVSTMLRVVSIGLVVCGVVSFGLISFLEFSEEINVLFQGDVHGDVPFW